LARISNELVDEAKSRYGSTGNLFYEAEGGFHLMSNDIDGNCVERQKFVKLSSNIYSRMGCGAW
jgi:hypothetical protein